MYDSFSVKRKGLYVANRDGPISGLNKPYSIRDREMAEHNTINQFSPNLIGPRHIVWLVDSNLKVSAQRLKDTQRQQVIAICRNKTEKFYKDYGFFSTLVEKDFHTCESILTHDPQEVVTDLEPLIEEHQQFLQHLGEIEKVVARCRENGYKLTGLCRDLRCCNPEDLMEQMNVFAASTNFINFYNFNQPKLKCRSLIHLWRSQSDPQIDALNKELEIR